MTRIIALTLTLAASTASALGHEPGSGLVTSSDTLAPEHGWVTELLGQLSLSQAAYSNWQEGGVSSLAATSNLRGRFARAHETLRQRHDGRLGFGIIRQDTLAVRKALDVIRYAFDLQYTALGQWQPTFSTELRTQFVAGHDYDPTPDRYPALADLIVPGERLKVSDFFAPATWTHSLGMSYEPGTWFRARSGLGVKQTIVAIERLRPVHGNELDEPVRNEIGLDGLVEARGEPFENVHVQSRLLLFQAFTQFADAAPDILWENVVQLRVNRWLSINAEFAALYDRDVIDRVQLKEVVSLGLTLQLL